MTISNNVLERLVMLIHSVRYGENAKEIEERLSEKKLPANMHNRIWEISVFDIMCWTNLSRNTAYQYRNTLRQLYELFPTNDIDTNTYDIESNYEDYIDKESEPLPK